MNWQDVFNGAMEVLGVVMVMQSIRKLLVDQKLLGVHPQHVAYSVVSSWWLTYYYAHLDQWFSFACAIGYVVAVGAWVLLILRYAFWPSNSSTTPLQSQSHGEP